MLRRRDRKISRDSADLNGRAALLNRMRRSEESKLGPHLRIHSLLLMSLDPLRYRYFGAWTLYYFLTYRLWKHYLDPSWGCWQFVKACLFHSRKLKVSDSVLILFAPFIGLLNYPACTWPWVLEDEHLFLFDLLLLFAEN